MDDFVAFLQAVKKFEILNHPGPAFSKEGPSQPVFDFRKIDLAFKEEAINAVYSDAQQAFVEGKLPIPYQQCWYLVDDGIYYQIKHLTPSELQILVFTSVSQTPPVRECLVATMKGPELSLHLHPAQEHLNDLPEKHELCASICSTIISLTYLLACPKSHNLNVVNPTLANKLRKTRGEPLLAPRREVRFDLSFIKEYVPKGSSHSSPVPHLRRAHYRRLNNGVMIPVRESRVLGGKRSPLTTIADWPEYIR